MIADFQMAPIAITVIRFSLCQLPNDNGCFRPWHQINNAKPPQSSALWFHLKPLPLQLMMQVNWRVIIWDFTGKVTGCLKQERLQGCATSPHPTFIDRFSHVLADHQSAARSVSVFERKLFANRFRPRTWWPRTWGDFDHFSHIGQIYEWMNTGKKKLLFMVTWPDKSSLSKPTYLYQVAVDT